MSIYKALAAVRDHLAKEGLGKNQTNQHQGFKFRGVDDLLGILQPALVAGGVVMAPDLRAVERKEYTTDKGKLQFYTVVTVAYHLTTEDGNSAVAYTYAGEAADTGDKSLSKALTMAFKSFCFHVFQIPLNGNDDADKHTADATAPPPIPPEVKDELRSAAAHGLAALKDEWKAVPEETRKLIATFHADWWSKTKEAAEAYKPKAFTLPPDERALAWAQARADASKDSDGSQS